MIRFLLFAILYLSINTAISQNYNVPKEYSFNFKEDYEAYEPRVVETMQWLLQTPLDTDLNKRKKATAFVLDWMGGTPDVKVYVDDKITGFVNKDIDLLMAFMIGWSQYSLENEIIEDLVLCNKAGVETAVDFYRRNETYLKKNEELEKYEKLIKKGKLEQEIKKRLK